jgi:hypothetical protein
MTASQFVLGFLRLAAIILPAALLAHRLRKVFLHLAGPLALLAEAVIALSALLISAELLGLVSMDRLVLLAPVLVFLAGLSYVLSPRSSPRELHDPIPSTKDVVTHTRSGQDVSQLAAIVGVIVVGAQWCLQTTNALGTGMFNFDTLWYHMPFAAHFAQSGSVTGIQFTQADPFVAYYPANSELFHAIGIGALHSDFLSPILNLMWLSVALLAAWCWGRPWQVERPTLLAGCVIASLPVLSGTQPGQAFNDIVGLATLMAGVAFMVNASDEPPLLTVAGLALGLAVGTKFTFVIPTIVLVIGWTLRETSGKRVRTFGLLSIPTALTGGWWYLRNIIAVGNPIGLKAHLGPLVLSGPQSQLANELQQTVISEIRHFSLWGSRFAPGLDHAFGPLWPLILALYIAAVVTGVWLAKDSMVRVLAIAAALTGISYLFLPTGASGIAQSTEIFQVNLRYATPALVLGILIVPIVVRSRIPNALSFLSVAFAVVVLVSQLEHELWPTQTARHAVFLIVVAGLAGVLWVARAIRPRLSLALIATAIPALVLVTGGATFALQRHYFHRRYVSGFATNPGLGQLYHWAQGVAHARIALYGTVEQYPLYGARDTNIVSYLGERTQDGGYRPISSCQRWRSALAAGRYQWVIITPAPTRAEPLAWTQSDRAMHLILQPGPGIYVFKVIGVPRNNLC